MTKLGSPVATGIVGPGRQGQDTPQDCDEKIGVSCRYWHCWAREAAGSRKTPQDCEDKISEDVVKTYLGGSPSPIGS